jgi:hypothetical protein
VEGVELAAASLRLLGVVVRTAVAAASAPMPPLSAASHAAPTAGDRARCEQLLWQGRRLRALGSAELLRPLLLCALNDGYAQPLQLPLLELLGELCCASVRTAGAALRHGVVVPLLLRVVGDSDLDFNGDGSGGGGGGGDRAGGGNPNVLARQSALRALRALLRGGKESGLDTGGGGGGRSGGDGGGGSGGGEGERVAADALGALGRWLPAMLVRAIVRADTATGSGGGGGGGGGSGGGGSGGGGGGGGGVGGGGGGQSGGDGAEGSEERGDEVGKEGGASTSAGPAAPPGAAR